MSIQVEGVDSVSSLNIEWEREAQPAGGALAARGVARGLTRHSTGARVSGSLIVELAVAVLNARPVNSGVRQLRCIIESCLDTKLIKTLSFVCLKSDTRKKSFPCWSRIEAI